MKDTVKKILLLCASLLTLSGCSTSSKAMQIPTVPETTAQKRPCVGSIEF